MARYTGKDLYIMFKGILITGDQRTFDVNRNIDMVDMSAGSDTDRSHLTTLADADFALSLLDDRDAAGSATITALALGQAGTLTYGPQGTAVGLPKYECQATVLSQNLSFPFDGEVELNATLQKNGTWALNFEDSGSVW